MRGRNRSRQITRLVVAILAASLIACGWTEAKAHGYSITEAGVATSVNGQFSRQAGAHPDLRVLVGFPSRQGPRTPEPDGSTREIRAALPPGLVGNATNYPTCTDAQLVAGYLASTALCPTSSQIGVARVRAVQDSPEGGSIFPIYNMEPPNESPVEFGFNVFGAVVRVQAEVRPGDYGVTSFAPRVSQGLALSSIELKIWGVPADPSHDGERIETKGEAFSAPTSSAASRLPFLTSPTSCPAAPDVIGLSADTWEEPGLFAGVSLDSDFDGVPFQMEGCDRLAFAPTATVEPSSKQTSSPTGVKVEIDVPQSEGPDGLATADVKDTVVTLPKGMTISASAAVGQGACSVAEVGLGTNGAPTCPDSSKLGSVEIKSPLLEEPLDGSVFLATPHQNPFGSLIAMYLVVKGPGFYIKLPGQIDADPQTGQLTASFRNQPQLPSKVSPWCCAAGRAPRSWRLTACGTYQTHFELTSWASSSPVSFDSPMKITEGCGGGRLLAGPQGGDRKTRPAAPSAPSPCR